MLFLIGAALEGVGVLMSLVELLHFGNLDLAVESEEPSALAFALATCFGVLMIAVYVTTSVFFCVWVNRANKNARALGAEGMTFTPGWYVGWFFIPIANLFKAVPGSAGDLPGE